MTSPALHPDLEPLAFLLGTWTGSGDGHYPTIEDFHYVEEVNFWHWGTPVIGYSQRTRSPGGEPLHGEMGYWRPVADGAIEVVLAHPFGLVEVQAGRLEETRIELESLSTVGTPTAKDVTRVRRTLEVAGNEMVYDLEMAAVGHPLTHHLQARLTRTHR